MGSVDNWPTNFLANIVYRLLPELKSVIRACEMRASLILVVAPFDFIPFPSPKIITRPRKRLQNEQSFDKKNHPRPREHVIITF